LIGQQRLQQATAERPATSAVRVKRIAVRPSIVGGYALMLLLALVYLVPLLFVLMVSLMSNRQFSVNSASLPSPILWTNYPDAWIQGSFSTYFGNTLLYTSSVVILTLIISTLAAFPIARNHVRFSNFFYILFLSGILLPAGVIPQFFVMQTLGLYDSRFGYILLWTSRVALPIFILTGFIKDIPTELDDAAAIDGCGYIRYILTIVMPLLRPAQAVVGLIVAIRVWNDIIGPVIFLPTNSVKPVSAGLFQFFSQFTANWPLIAAAIGLTAAPLLLLYIFTQRYIIAGMTSGALKG
jgi:raffinose/stachyose/melibiose transport system permease protein